MIELGADIHIHDDLDGTPLWWSVFDNNPEIIEMLIRLDQNLNIANETTNDGVTLLMWAAQYNKNPEVLKLLIDLGVEINAQDEDGNTALMWAFATEYEKNSTLEKIKVLVELGADVNLKNNDGKTALDYAKEKDDKEIIDILIEHGAK